MTSPSISNIRVGTELNDVLDLCLHPTQDSGAGNPLVIYRHTGGGTNGHKGEVFNGEQPNMATLFDYLLSPSRSVHFNVATIESAQQSWNSSFIPRSIRTHHPGIITSYQRNVRNARMVLKDYNCDPSRVILLGASHGAWLNIMQMLLAPDFGGSGQRNDRRKRFETFGYNSRVKGCVQYEMSYPDWRRSLLSNGITFAGATLAGASLTLAGAFAHYRWVSGDQCFITGVGTFDIASKTNNNTIVLTSPPAGGTYSGYVSTDYTDLSFSNMLFGTRQTGTDAGGVPLYAEWDALPASLKGAVSPMDWVEQNQLAFAVPTYFVTEGYGDGIHPYGNSYNVGSDVHDWHIARDLSDALRAKGKSSTYYNNALAGTTPWTNGTIPALLYNWMVARIQE